MTDAKFNDSLCSMIIIDSFSYNMSIATLPVVRTYVLENLEKKTMFWRHDKVISIWRSIPLSMYVFSRINKWIKSTFPINMKYLWCGRNCNYDNAYPQWYFIDFAFTYKTPSTFFEYVPIHIIYSSGVKWNMFHLCYL